VCDSGVFKQESLYFIKYGREERSVELLRRNVFTKRIIFAAFCLMSHYVFMSKNVMMMPSFLFYFSLFLSIDRCVLICRLKLCRLKGVNRITY